MTSTMERIAQRAYSSRETLQATYDISLAVLQNGVPGDFVECGVAAGAQIAAMALAMRDAGQNRTIHLFDSFCGIPKGGEFDNDIRSLVGTAAGPELETSGVTSCSLAQVHVHMNEWGIPESLLVYHEGWFQNTVPVAQIGEIAVLRLDGDLYDSTRVCMEHLYPKLAVGGWCIVDDFDLDGCRKAILEATSTGPVYFQRHPA